MADRYLTLLQSGHPNRIRILMTVGKSWLTSFRRLFCAQNSKPSGVLKGSLFWKPTTLCPIDVFFTANAPVFRIDSLAFSAEKRYGDAMACSSKVLARKEGHGLKLGGFLERTPR